MSEHDELRKLAAKLQRRGDGAVYVGPSAGTAASIGATIDAVLDRYPDPPATDEEMRECLRKVREPTSGSDGEGWNFLLDDDEALKLLSLLRPSPASEQGLREAWLYLRATELRIALQTLYDAVPDCYGNDLGKACITARKTLDAIPQRLITRPPQEEKHKPCTMCEGTGALHYSDNDPCPNCEGTGMEVDPPTEPPDGKRIRGICGECGAPVTLEEYEWNRPWLSEDYGPYGKPSEENAP